MKLIIVADDDFRQRDLYVDLFRSAGFKVIPVNDGQEAWEQAQGQHPDLVFTGIMMPRMTGFELIEKLRANKATSSIPVIVFSHLGRDTDRAKAEIYLNVQFMIKGYDSPASILKAAQMMMKKNPPSPAAAIDDDEREPVNLL